jgi:hypothetical protein
MLSVLIIGGGLLGVLLGAALRASDGPRGWSDSKKLILLVAVIPGAGVIGLFQALPGQGSRLPQLCGYLVSLLTGYIVTAMLETPPGSVEAGGPAQRQPGSPRWRPTRELKAER